MYGYILCNNKQELNLSATGAVCEMHENNFLRSLTDLKSRTQGSVRKKISGQRNNLRDFIFKHII